MTTGRYRRWMAIVAVAIVAIVMFYALVPVGSEWLPRCPIRWLTGYDCPGCGSQRALQHLLRGNFSEALRANAFAFIAFPAIVATIYADYNQQRCPRLARVLLSRWAIMVWIVVILAWTIVRNMA